MKQLTLLFLRKNDQILLAMKKRGFGAGKWNGIGGKVEADESLEEATIRECQEEIGVTPLEFHEVADIRFYQYDQGGYHEMHVHAFMSREWEGEPTETEEMAPQWFETPNIPYDTMWADDIHWLPRVLAGEKLIGTFSLDETGAVQENTLESVESFTR